MRALCIKSNNTWVDGNGDFFTGPKYGDVVTATQCALFPDNYRLKEYPGEPDGRQYSFRKQFFIPLSSISETELLAERENKLTTV